MTVNRLGFSVGANAYGVGYPLLLAAGMDPSGAAEIGTLPTISTCGRPIIILPSGESNRVRSVLGAYNDQDRANVLPML